MNIEVQDKKTLVAVDIPIDAGSIHQNEQLTMNASLITTAGSGLYSTAMDINNLTGSVGNSVSVQEDMEIDDGWVPIASFYDSANLGNPVIVFEHPNQEEMEIDGEHVPNPNVTELENHTQVLISENQELTNPNIYEVFSQFQPRHGTFWINAVSVYSIYKDTKENKLYLFLVDRNRDKAVAVVPSNLVEEYEAINLEGFSFAIEQFRFEYLGCDDFPRYKGYYIHRFHEMIWITKNTKFTPVDIKAANPELPIYPTTPSFHTLVNDNANGKLLIDVIGQLMESKFVNFLFPLDECRQGYLELKMKDFSGQITMRIYDYHRFRAVPLARAIQEKKLAFVSRLKLMHTSENNILISTDLTKIVYEPKMQLAEELNLLRI